MRFSLLGIVFTQPRPNAVGNDPKAGMVGGMIVNRPVGGVMKRVVEWKNDEGKTFCRIDRTKKRGSYTILESDRQTEAIHGPVRLEGFESLPSGFYRNGGYGFTLAGALAIQEIHQRFKKKVAVTVSAAGSAKVDGRGRHAKAFIPHAVLQALGQKIRNIKRDRNEEMRVAVQHILGKTFTQFRDMRDAEAGYIPGRVAEILGMEAVEKRLSVEDRAALEEFIPDYLSSIPGTLRAKKKLKVIYDSLDAGRKIYLSKVIKEFRRKLKARVQNEQTWQTFLSEYILVLRNTYGEVLEKNSVSIQGKFPDFMLIDAYGYLDIYEIKKPSTRLLALDRGRNNYYWDPEISKAIAQVENYIHQAQRHADVLRTDIQKSKGVDVNIVRPQGYIVAGTRSQLASPKMADDFRILSESLKNIDVILYDDLLASLEAFVQKSDEH